MAGDKLTGENAAKEALIKKGYSRVKAGAVNMPGYSRIETWMKRSGTVYLVYNEAGEWDVMKSVFTSDPTVDALAESTAV